MYNLQKSDLLKPKTRCNIKAVGDNNYYDFVVTNVLESKVIVRALKASCSPNWKVINPRLKARTLNISGGGLCFTWSSPLPKDTLIALELSFDKSYFRKDIVIRALGEVKRCVEHNRKYIISIEFKEIDERFREKIISFIFEQMRKDAKSKRLSARNLQAFS
ncbi:MAG: PilZ domain-containing protein [Thermoanaerobacteraceae bacterium]|nr:PilZ domain-containing protein [Thermoanaerobacteraceae bacterium]